MLSVCPEISIFNEGISVKSLVSLSNSAVDSTRKVDLLKSKNILFNTILFPTSIFFIRISLTISLYPVDAGISKFSEWNKYPSALTAIP